MAKDRETLVGRVRALEEAVELTQGRIDDQIATTAGDLAESFGPEIASVISDTIERWDAKEAAERIELYVGRDLQYIRINGTVIGALVGLLLHTVIVLLPG